MKTIKNRIFDLCHLLEQSKSLNAVNASIVALIPFIIVSSFITVIVQFPIPGYQEWAKNCFVGAILQIFDLMNVCLLECLSLFMSLEIGLNYAKREFPNDSTKFILPCITVSIFLLFVGVFSPDFKESIFGRSGLFSSILGSLIGCKSYVFVSNLCNKINRKKRKYMDYTMSGALFSIVPSAITIGFYAAFSGILYACSGGYTVQSLFELFLEYATSLFSGNMIILDIVYLTFCQILWFFGIHGPHTMYNVGQNYFHFAALNGCCSASQASDCIINGSFNNFYVNIGGCGATLSLLFMILIFSKKKYYRSMAKISIIPSLFNINELMIFGIPLAFNPIYFIPFVIVPIVNVLISYFATFIGLVPVASAEITWATPIILGGYLATGSIRGSFLQLFLLVIDCVIYLPFVRFQDEVYQIRFLNMVKKLTLKLQEMEANNDNRDLLSMPGDIGQTAHLLVNDLEDAVDKKALFMLYQPQFHSDGTCIGAEALLRWNHPQAGFIYPPLIIVLAREGGFLPKLEDFIFDESCKTLSEICKITDHPYKISVNITGASLKYENFESSLKACIDKYQVDPHKLWIEITEQDALASTSEIVEKLNRIKEQGHKLLIDDFGMGHTSINYLQTNLFDVVKLDGCITRTVLENKRNQDIISSIVFLSQSLNFMIISEYVENEEQRDKLVELGCNTFQGYLYSKPISADEFKKLLHCT